MIAGETAGAWARRLQRAWLSRGPLAVALLPLAGLFAAVTAIRRLAYRRGWLRVHMLPVPVIVVGNLIVGGAGKTPTVMAVVALLRRNGFHPGIVSRGYGRVGGAVLGIENNTDVLVAGDEPLLLRLATGVPVFVGNDRVSAGLALLRRHPEIDIVVSDDGLQHLRLARTVQVLVFDERGAGNAWLLPAGPLREALPPSTPARSLVLYNAPERSTSLPGSMVERSLRAPIELPDWRSDRAAGAVGSSRPADFSVLRGRPLLAAAGLAHPERFFTMLRRAGLSFTTLALPDHARYATLPWPAGTSDVIVTEKDAIKLDPRQIGAGRVWVVGLDFAPAADFEAALLELLPARGSRIPRSPCAPTPGLDDGNATS